MENFRRRLTALLSFLLLSTWAIAAGDDAKDATIRGTVKINDGKPAADVTVIAKGTKKSATTDEKGIFILRNLDAGTYEIQVSLVGYETASQTVTVTENATTTVDFSLNLSEAQLEEVIVISNRSKYKVNKPSPTLRLAEPLIEAPQNIQVITSKVLADQQATSMNDGVIRNVSGATKQEHWGDLYARVNMRGSRASAFRNGMNVTSTWGPLTEDMSFVDHIEFVKGPSGFMMSNGEPSGIYNVVTKRPTGQYRGEASLLLGSYDLYRAALDLDGHFDKANKLQYRFNLMGQTRNSFRANEYSNRYSIAPVITYKIDDKTSLTAEYIFQHVNMSNVGTYYVFATQGFATTPRNFSLLPSGVEPTKINDHNLTLNLQHSFNSNWKLTAQISYFNYSQVGSSSWVNSVAANGNTIRYISLWDATNVSKFGQVFLNGNVQTGSIQHRILAGLDKGDKEYLADFGQSFVLDTPGTFNIYRSASGAAGVKGLPKFDRSLPLAQRAGVYGATQQYTGGYLQDELGFFDNKLRLTLAGRLTYVQDQTSYFGVSGTNVHRFTPRAGLSYSVDANTSVYALYDQSFVPQTGIQRGGKLVAPQTGNNIEAGIKKDWLGGRWNTTVSVYRILKNNQLIADPNNTASESFVLQLGQTKTQGVELDIRGEIARGLNVVVNYAYTDSRISKESSLGKVGDVVPGYAKHTANTWLTYHVPSGAIKGLGINAGFTYLHDRTTWSWGANGQIPLPDYFKLDGGLSYDKGNISVNFNVFNLLNRYLYSGAYYGYGGFYYWQAEAGRNSRAGVSYRF